MTVVAETLEPTMPSPCVVHMVTEEEVTAYRRVVRSAIDSDSSTATDLASPSPVHPFVLTSPMFDAALRSLAAATGVHATVPTPVHLSEEIRIHRPLRVGERVVVSSDVIGFRADPRGGRVALRSQLTVPDGAAIAELLTTALLIGDVPIARFGHVPLQRGRGVASWSSTVTHRLPRDLPRRYAAVSGSDNVIHRQSAAAGAVGFPDIVAQGMSIVALACEEIIDRHAGGDPRRVRAVGARFSGPVVPGEPLEICISDVDGGLVRFCCRTPRGVAVRKAWVEIGLERTLAGAAS